MSLFELSAVSRTALGRKVNALRREGLVPGNIVCKGKESRTVQMQYLEIEKALNTVGYTQPVEISLGDDKVTVLVTDVTVVPAKNTIEHVTFQEVRKGEKVTAEVPLNMVGDAPGVQQGLVLLQVLSSVEVEAGALSIPEHIDIDVSVLVEDGDTVRVSSLVVPEGVAIKVDADATVARVEAPRAVEEPEEVEEPAEGEEGEAAAEDGEESAESSEE